MNNRSHQLKVLGLRQWRPRSGSPASADVASELPVIKPTVFRASSDPVALVLVLSESPLLENDPRVQLLDKVLASLRALPARFTVLEASDLAAFSKESLRGSAAPAGRVLAFVGMNQRVPDAMSLPTLEAMLADPGQKRPAWQVLKPLVGQLGP